MAEHVVVLGAGYAGAGAVNRLEAVLDDASITWIADRDYHLVLHESHRCIRDPTVRDRITIPVTAIKSPETTFIEGEVVDVRAEDGEIETADGSTLDFDYLLVAIGSRTAFFGIPGLREHAHTLKSLDDALGIHEAVAEASEAASIGDPAEVVVGGAGLSGVQVAGELAEFRDERDAPLDITLIEGLDEVLPNADPGLQRPIRRRLETEDVGIETGSFISEVDEDTVYVGEVEPYDYDVLIWTGGITGREAVADSDLDRDDRSDRIEAGQDFRTNHDDVFAIGDCALVDQPGDDPAPPTAQAAWQAADVAAENVARAIRGEPLERWRHEDMGTVVSVGESAVAHDVTYKGIDLPKRTFGGYPAKFLKKTIAARWINKVAGPSRAIKAFPDM